MIIFSVTLFTLTSGNFPRKLKPNNIGKSGGKRHKCYRIVYLKKKKKYHDTSSTLDAIGLIIFLQ